MPRGGHRSEGCIEWIARMERHLLHRHRRQDHTGHDRRMGVGVDVSREASPIAGRCLLRPVLERRLDPVEVRPPQQPGEHARCDQCEHGAGREPAVLLQGDRDGVPERHDDLAERHDDDQRVSFGEVAGAEDPLAAARPNRRVDEDHDAEDPRGGAGLAVEEAADHDDRHPDAGSVRRSADSIGRPRSRCRGRPPSVPVP